MDRPQNQDPNRQDASCSIELPRSKRLKILAISDKVVSKIYDAKICERFQDVGMVLSCGDLPYSYLEYIVTMLNVPCLYVHGNHDQPEHTASGQTLHKPGGWVNVDGRAVLTGGVIVAGLEGSIRYKPHGAYQYTERQMVRKVWTMMPSLYLNRVRYGRYLDVLITHAPPFGIHDGKDWAHRGFKVFLWLMARFRPRYHLHGHKHIYCPQTSRTTYLQTDVMNVYPYRVIEWEAT